MSTLTSIKMGLLLIRIKLGSIFTTDKSYPKDPDPKNWRTIRGAKVHLSNGKIDGGAGGKFMSNAWVGKEKHGNNSFFPLSQMNYKKGSMGNIQTGIKKPRPKMKETLILRQTRTMLTGMLHRVRQRQM